ncbi:hypothetical protein NL676_029563 [Syzygium grande]|nr:hypothetical protein NL676_029563 [Syzygium grande]
MQAPSQGCHVEKIGLKQCSKQDEGSIETCCIALNAVIREGFDCFCSLFTSSEPLLGNGFSLLSSNCYLSIPPLALCQDGALAVVFPPIMPKDGELSSALGGPDSANVTLHRDSAANQNEKSEAGQFRYVGFRYYDEMRSLFDGAAATGKESWGLVRAK